ncbi:sialidase-1 [Tessaracoccus bendigoensis DSM 12906]|uniref:exo-alpha-sialidase n=1 Tax=Tessaracoccus bendigoensis DSM 12906 TaxID=1123357 RepID=A0A1M6DXR2_9ACTN|nr:sialidase family protein [Tessaracoccus bendigoensis]SHI78001.1 sialidase-1 [Tessaracoccus bendigoensis DSM 12906]
MTPESSSSSDDRTLARRGLDGYRQYRIPALAVSTRGTLLAAYDGRPNLDDLPSPIDLLLRRSTDGGRTWLPQQVVRTGTGLEGFGDPSLIVDATTGRINLFHAAGTHAGFFEAVEGLEPDDAVQHVDLSVSDDDGLTWQHRRLTAQLKRPGVAGLFAASGQGTQLHTGRYAGRLVQQFVLLEHGTITAASAWSDDHGDTWRLGAAVGPGTNESKVACLHDGRLLLHSRATPRRLMAVSDDGGETWSPTRPDEALVDPSDNGSLCRFDGAPMPGLASPDTDAWLLATHNHDEDLRRATVLKLSRDNGETWPHAVTLCPGSSAYSSATRLPDGRIGVLYERAGYGEIVFTTVDPDRLLAAGPAALTVDPCSVLDGRGVSLEAVLRSVTPGRPASWRSVGESVTLSAADAAWDRSVRKEVGVGYDAQAPQVLSDRASQDLNYGPVGPGLRVGDTLALHVRVRTVERAEVRVCLDGEALHSGELAAGERVVIMVARTVKETDVSEGVVRATFTLDGAGGDPARLVLEFCTATGESNWMAENGSGPSSP